MYRMRRWSVQHARGMKKTYALVERVLRRLQPMLRRIGYKRLEVPMLGIEKLTKGFFLDSQSCGQCIVGDTGLSCPMNCPKRLRNGPCGGVRFDGGCEVFPDMQCVWVAAWEGNKILNEDPHRIQNLQPPVDNRLVGHSAWLRELRSHDLEIERRAD